MTTDTATTPAATDTTDSATRSRVALLAIVLGTTSILAIAGLFWPSPAGGGETYAFSDIAGQRDLWWGSSPP